MLQQDPEVFCSAWCGHCSSYVSFLEWGSFVLPQGPKGLQGWIVFQSMDHLCFKNSGKLRLNHSPVRRCLCESFVFISPKRERARSCLENTCPVCLPFKAASFQKAQETLHWVAKDLAGVHACASPCRSWNGKGFHLCVVSVNSSKLPELVGSTAKTSSGTC